MTVTGSVGAYPLKWSRTLNTRALTGGWLGTGGGWTHSYQWSLVVASPPPYPPPDPPYEGPDATVSYPDSRKVDFYWDAAGSAFSTADGPAGVLHRLTNLGNSNYDLTLGDGGKVQFRRTAYIGANGLTAYGPIAQAIVDPHGQSTALQRDPYGRLIKVIEPGGRYLQINYVTYGSGGRIDNVQAFSRAGVLTATETETVRYSYTSIRVITLRPSA